MRTIRPFNVLPLLCLTAAGTSVLPADPKGELELVRLPRIIVEQTMEVNGKVVKSEEITAIGMYALPWNVQPWAQESIPPMNFEEKKSSESITINGRQFKATRLEWTPQAEGYKNSDARKVTVWVTDDLPVPPHRVHFTSPNLALPKGTVRFEYLPLEIAPDSKLAFKIPGLTTVHGEWMGTRKITILGRQYDAYQFAIKSRSQEQSFDGHVWISEGMPGLSYETRGKATRGKEAATVMRRAKKIELEELPTDLRQHKTGLFAVRLPKGWKEVALEGAKEVIRLIPASEMKGKKRAVTVEIEPASGKDYEQWMNDDRWGAKLKGGPIMSLGSEMGMADVPTFTLHLSSASSKWARTCAYGCVHEGRFYLLSHWQDRVADDEVAGSDLIDDMLKSWRWFTAVRLMS